MSDDADRADQEVERDIAEAMRKRRPNGPPPIGFCHFCNEMIEPGLRWCPGTDCERGWEYEQERKAANGNPDSEGR